MWWNMREDNTRSKEASGYGSSSPKPLVEADRGKQIAEKMRIEFMAPEARKGFSCGLSGRRLAQIAAKLGTPF
jgi:hypothetical protein